MEKKVAGVKGRGYYWGENQKIWCSEGSQVVLVRPSG
jgi:hypothetical protein